MRPDRRRQILTMIVDEGGVEDPAGLVHRVIAGRIGRPPGQVSTILSRLEADGLITREWSNVSGRCFRVQVTLAGREELGRGKHVGTAVRPRPTERVRKPAVFPVLGPIGHLDFDPDRVREAVG